LVRIESVGSAAHQRDQAAVLATDGFELLPRLHQALAHETNHVKSVGDDEGVREVTPR
jgi:hypothetical protein